MQTQTASPTDFELQIGYILSGMVQLQARITALQECPQSPQQQQLAAAIEQWHAAAVADLVSIIRD